MSQRNNPKITVNRWREKRNASWVKYREASSGISLFRPPGWMQGPGSEANCARCSPRARAQCTCSEYSAAGSRRRRRKRRDVCQQFRVAKNGGEWIDDRVGSAGGQAPKCGEFLRCGHGARLHGFSDCSSEAWERRTSGEVPWQEEFSFQKNQAASRNIAPNTRRAEMSHILGHFFSERPEKARPAKKGMATIASGAVHRLGLISRFGVLSSPGCRDAPYEATTVIRITTGRKGCIEGNPPE